MCGCGLEDLKLANSENEDLVKKRNQLLLTIKLVDGAKDTTKKII